MVEGRVLIKCPVTGEPVYTGMSMDPETFRDKSFEKTELVWPHWIRTVVEDDNGKVWYGSEKGLGYYDLQNKEFQNFPMAAFDAFSFRPEVAKGMDVDEYGRIWCATSRRGIIVFNEHNGRINKVKELTAKDGLSGMVFTQLSTGPHGDMWISHTEGFTRINPRTFDLTNYGKWAGLGSIYSFTFHKDTLIANGADGVYIGALPVLDSMSSVPQPYLSSVLLYGQTIKNWQGRPHEFHHTENFFEFELSAFNHLFPANIEYAYRLNKHDPWHQPTRNSVVNFPHLAPDDYDLWLRARFPGGAWSPPMRATSFTVNKPYWQTFWFIGAVVLLVSTTIFAIFRYRIYMLKKKAALEKKVQDLEMRALRVQMNPHFMFNALNSVRYFILKEDRHKASDYLTHFSKLLRKILYASRQNLITLEDELKSLELYLEFEKARFDDKFDYDIQVQQEVNTTSVQLQPLIVQPFVENAIWHGLMKKEGKGKLQISVSMNGSHLLISVEDNGIGRIAAEQQKAKAHKSFGMEITRQRLQLFKNRTNKDVGYTVEDLYENGQPAGTRVNIKLTAL
jgi:hypothetical protein